MSAISKITLNDIPFVFAGEKKLILVINKVDLIPADLALAWKDYFEKKFPNLSVVFFSSCPSYNLSSGLTTTKSGLKFRRLRGRISMVAEGARYNKSN
jgi:ribosome biogenesis GTPase A